MKRRTFLKSMFMASALVIPLPAFTKSSIDIVNPLIKESNDDFYIDRDTKTIEFIGKEDVQYTVLDFHRWLQDQADQHYLESDMFDITDENPSLRLTDRNIELVAGYHINDDTAKHLTNGTITQFTENHCAEYYTNIGITDEKKNIFTIVTN